MFDFVNSPTVGQQQLGPSGAVYQWDGAKWMAVAAQVAVSSQGNVGRNVIHNPMMAVAQRGGGPFTAFAAYTLDRWYLNGNLDTASVIYATLADSDRSQIGDEAANACLQNTFTGNAGAAAFNSVSQYIEGVRRLAGKSVTVSFWARAWAGTPKLGINLYQSFGTGGSPSAGGWVLATGAAVTLSTTWTRYSTTVAMPSVAGKTLGTNNNDSTVLVFPHSSGSNSNAIYGNIGVQSGTVQLWGIQLEIAAPGQTQPTPLERIEYADDLRHCQRFFETSFSATPET